MELNELVEARRENETRIDIADRETYIKLKHKIQSLDVNGSLVNSLLDLTHKHLEIYKKGEDNPETIINSYDIDEEECFDRHENHFKCLCGKRPLSVLHIFQHEQCEQNLIIGSECISHIKELGDLYTENARLTKKIKEIIEARDTCARRRTHNKCKICKDLCIRKDYEYKNPWHRYFCSGCMYGKDKICCQGKFCCEKITIEPIKKNGKMTYKKLCKGCWKIENGFAGGSWTSPTQPFHKSFTAQ